MPCPFTPSLVEFSDIPIPSFLSSNHKSAYLLTHTDRFILVGLRLVLYPRVVPPCSMRHVCFTYAHFPSCRSSATVYVLMYMIVSNTGER